MSNESYVKAILDGTADKEVIFDRLSDMAMDAMNSVSSIDELSKSTLGSYIKKSKTDIEKKQNVVRELDKEADDQDDNYAHKAADQTRGVASRLASKSTRRLNSVGKAGFRMAKESEERDRVDHE
jgi:hypothetical protein